MLVWSPNHCVSDAKREWVGPRVPAYPWGVSWVHASQGQLFSRVVWRLRCGFNPYPGAQAGGEA